MRQAEPRSYSKEAQLARILDTARAAGLTVYAIEISPRMMRIQTQPLVESPPAEDAADRWLRGRRGAREVAGGA